MAKNIVVVGAGVSGLTTALLLSRDTRYEVTVAAKHMPGDYDIEYASPWAGANYWPTSPGGTQKAEWERVTWAPLEDLARNHPEAGVHFQKSEITTRKKDLGRSNLAMFEEIFSPNPCWRSTVPDFKQVPQSELSEGIAHAISFTSVCINTAIYLPWLLSQCLKNRVVFKRANFQHISDAASPGVHHSGRPADLLVNCTGLGSLRLGGVHDKLLHPVRGQIVVVKNDAGRMYTTSGCDDGDEEEGMYIMTRAAGGGTILGGCFQSDRWESQPDLNLAVRIMQRCIAACPKLTDGKGIEYLDIIRHGVGLRPVRDGGPRVEKEEIDGVLVVHNFGHGGAGYQMSYGCSQTAVEMVEEALTKSARL